MTSPDKLLSRALRNPAGLYWRELKVLLDHLGFALTHVGGDHYVFRRGDERVTARKPERGPVDPDCVKRLLDLSGAGTEPGPGGA